MGTKMKKRELTFPELMFFLLLNIWPAITYAHADEAPTKLFKHQYTFTTDWFTDRIPAWTRVLKEFKGKPDINYLEIGVFEGRSALWVLENVLTHPTAKAIMIDAFQEPTYQTFTSNVSLSGEANKFRVLIGFSTDKIKELPNNSIDFAYINGSARGIEIQSDLVNTWNLLKINGIIICARYRLDKNLRNNFHMQPGDPGPFETVDAFLKLYKPYIKVLTFEENQVIFRKIRQ
jgi:hypothetical protein